MNTAVLVALIVAVLAIIAMGTFLATIAVTLKAFSARLTQALATLGAVAEQTQPVGPAVEALQRDLRGAQKVLQSALEHADASGPARPPDPDRGAGEPDVRAGGAPDAVSEHGAEAEPEPEVRDEPESEAEPEPEVRDEPGAEAEPEPEPDRAPAPRTGRRSGPDRLAGMRPSYGRSPGSS